MPKIASPSGLPVELCRTALVPETRPPAADTNEHVDRRAASPSSEVIDSRCYPFLDAAHGTDEIGWLAHYRVLELLGEGGVGLVFLAEDPRLQRRVAIKVMRPEMAENGTIRQRFLQEARA